MNTLLLEHPALLAVLWYSSVVLLRSLACSATRVRIRIPRSLQTTHLQRQHSFAIRRTLQYTCMRLFHYHMPLCFSYVAVSLLQLLIVGCLESHVRITDDSACQKKRVTHRHQSSRDLLVHTSIWSCPQTSKKQRSSNHDCRQNQTRIVGV
jgi:hypothetical protein